jgi:hypothetical protein
MAKHNLYKNAPTYAPNAVPTSAGWRDPITNELLVAIKLNMNEFSSTNKIEVVPEVQVEEVVPEVQVEEVISEVRKESTRTPRQIKQSTK